MSHDPYACLMAYWATKPDPDGMRALRFFDERKATDAREYAGPMAITIDGIEFFYGEYWSEKP